MRGRDDATLDLIGVRPRPSCIHPPARRAAAGLGVHRHVADFVRKSVPPSACSKRPDERAVAPVKAPFSWPNSSASMRSRGMAAMLMATKGPLRRLQNCGARARDEFLPVPLSPVIITVRSVCISRARAR